MPGEPLKPGAIYNSNRFTLRGLLQSLGCEVTDLGIVPDRLDATREALRRAAAGNDLIVTCGGVSVGEEDHLQAGGAGRGPARPVADRDQAGQAARLRRRCARRRQRLVHRPARQPGVQLRHLPARRAAGAAAAAGRARPRAARAEAARRTSTGRGPIAGANSCARGSASRAALELFPNQSSGVLTSVVWGDGLIDNPPGHAIVHGDAVRFLPFAELLR